MNLFQAIVMAVLQGATELFPISSLGHAVILPKLLQWPIDQKSPDFLPFLVVLHLGTATALLAYFWQDWRNFAISVSGKGSPETVSRERKTFLLICVATLPAVILGFALEHKLRAVFGSPSLAAIFLIVNGVILVVGDRFKHNGFKSLEALSFKSAFIIGTCQALALIPGISRSGSTMIGGVIAGLNHKDAARFSFLMATPVIAGAGVLEVPKLIASHSINATNGFIVIIAGIVAGLVAYLSTALLMKYFGKHELNALKPFGVYCWLAGALSLFLIS